MERKRHLEEDSGAVYDDIYSDLEPLQSKITKSFHQNLPGSEVPEHGQEEQDGIDPTEEQDGYDQYQDGLSDPVDPTSLDYEEGFVDEAEVDEFSFVDENPSMSQIQSAQSMTSLPVCSRSSSGQVAMTSQAPDELEHSDSYSCPNNQYMEMPPAKNTLQNERIPLTKGRFTHNFLASKIVHKNHVFLRSFHFFPL